MRKIGSRDVSLLGALSALVVVADAVPVTPIIGVPGARFTAGWVAATLSGIVGGPYLGTTAAFVGSLVSAFVGLRPLFLGPFTPLTPALAALQAGLLARGNWVAGGAAVSALTVAWILTPAAATPPTALYVGAVAAALVLRRRLELRAERLGGKSVATALAVAYIANATRHALGSLILVTVFNFSPEFFLLAAPLMVVEQATFAVVTALVAVPVLRALSKTPLVTRGQRLLRESGR